MPGENGERRSNRRVRAQVPVAVKLGGRAQQATGHTRDLSTTGIFFYTQAKMEPGSPLEMVLMLPPELTGGEKRWVCCQASVVRVEKTPSGEGFGVAAAIERMDALQELLE